MAGLFLNNDMNFDQLYFIIKEQSSNLNDLREYFQSEACSALAITLSRKYNLPLIIFKGKGDSEFPETVAHVAVFYNGKVLDSRGLSTVNDVKDRYYDVENLHVEKIDEKTLRRKYMGDNKPLFYPDLEDYENAKLFIDRVLSTYISSHIIENLDYSEAKENDVDSFTPERY